MGRKLYDEWSAYWPDQGPEVPFSEFINAIPKYVLSTTVTDPKWQNTTALSGGRGCRPGAQGQRGR